MSGSSTQDLCSHRQRSFSLTTIDDGKQESRTWQLSHWHSGARNAGPSTRSEALYVCDQCFGPLEVAYDFSGYDAAELKRKIQAGSRTGSGATPTSCRSTGRPADSLEPGLTPLIRADRLAEQLGVGEIWIKNDAANPTHSFKDRVVAVALAKAVELGFDTVACASTGNLANAVAAHAAAAGLESYVFVPSDLEEQKLLATGVYGTDLVGVNGNYDDVNRLCTELAEERGWAFVNVNLRPYYAEGSKTLAYETVEQLGWRLPDKVVCPIASGSLFTKIGRGFSEWLDLGLVEGELPRFHGAQADGLQPGRHRLRRRARRLPAGQAGHDRQEPRDRQPGRRALRARSRPHARAARSTSVTDDEIRAGIRLLAETTGDLHRDRRRRHHRGPREAGRSGRARPATTGSSSTSPARA